MLNSNGINAASKTDNVSVADKATRAEIRGWMKTVGSSTFILSLLFFLVVDSALRFDHQKKILADPEDTISSKLRAAAKLPQCIAENKDADVVLLGSSLMLVPTVRCDDRFHNKKTRYDRWYLRNVVHNYKNADYFQDLLNRELGKSVQVVDLAISAGMISDDYFILKKYLETGKRPQLIVLGVAPRDFLDTSRTNPTETPAFRLLSNASNLKEFAEANSTKQLFDFLFQCTVHCYRNRDGYQQLLTRMVEKKLKLTPENPLEKNVPQYELESDRLAADLNVYKDMYFPINQNCFNTQKDYLERVLNLAKSSQIPVLLVDMPITKENFALLPESVRNDYRSSVVSLATKYGAQLIRPDESSEFVRGDFDDSVHLNAQGGEKLFVQIAKAIPQSADLQSGTDRQISSTKNAWPF